MKVREIKDNPDEILKYFDYFNDYDDTMRYLMSTDTNPIIIKRLKDGYKLWVETKT